MAAQASESKDMETWKNRRNALWRTTGDRPGAIDSLFRKKVPSEEPKEEELVSAVSEPDLDLPNLETLAQCLGKFAEKQFEFFHDGFGDHKKYKLNESREWPPEYVFRVLLDQMAEDLEVIRRVADQRRSAEIVQNLKEADNLVWGALKPVIGPGKLVEDQAPPQPYEQRPLPEKTIVMSYFQKSASIRVIPYAPVALIGMPFTAGSVPRDYLSIPHEVGHYVYRHGKVYVNEMGEVVDKADKGMLQSIPQVLGRKLLEQPKLDQVRELQAFSNKFWEQANQEWKQAQLKPELQSLEPSPRYVRRWKEEIFADVYSCLIGGPVAALSIRDLMRQTSRLSLIQTPGEYLYGQFTEDDGVHPVPVLRPYVHTMTLRRISLPDEKLSQLADELDAQWQAFPQVQEVTEFRTRYANGPGAQYISVARTLLEVYRVVIEVLKLLPVSDFIESRWSGRNNQVTAVDGLYSEFEERRFGQLKEGVYRPAELEKPSEDLWVKWVQKENFFPGFPDGLPPPGTIIEPGKAHTLEGLEQEPRYTWNHVFLASGWATRPQGTGTQGILFPKNWRGQSDGGGSGGY